MKQQAHLPTERDAVAKLSGQWQALNSAVQLTAYRAAIASSSDTQPDDRSTGRGVPRSEARGPMFTFSSMILSL